MTKQSSADSLGAYFRAVVNGMKVGECVRFSRAVLEDAFPSHPWDGFFSRGGHVDKLLSGVVGSAWTIRTSEDPIDGTVTFRRVEETGQRWNVDPDRRHLFKRAADGSYEVDR